MTEAAVSRIVNGMRCPRVDTLADLCDGLRVSADELLFDQGRPTMASGCEVTDEMRREVAARLRALEVCDYDGEPLVDTGEIEDALGIGDEDTWTSTARLEFLAEVIDRPL